MNIQYHNSPPYPAHDFSGDQVSIGTPPTTVDLRALESDVQVTFTIFGGDSGAPDPDGPRTLAVIVIPPRSYSIGEITETVDGLTITYEGRVAQPLNIETVELHIYGLSAAEEA